MASQKTHASVVGHPIAQSQSPNIHGYWLDQKGVDGSYTTLDLSPEEFEAGIRERVAMGWAGVNVTVPHKEAALALADKADVTAQRIGASNTLVFKDGCIEARNTDAAGFWGNLESHLPNPQPKTALVLGAGGAARAILVALQDEGFTHIYLANRTLSRAEALAAELESDAATIDAMTWDQAEDMMNAQPLPLIINTSSRGMKGDNPILCALEAQGPETVVNDIVYNPLETTLLATARAKSCICVDGLGMLLHQARPAFEAFFGPRVEVDETLKRKIQSNLGLI